jgi:uncharacterized membrane protein
MTTAARWQRLWRHLASGPWSVRRHFPGEALAAIEQAVKDCEGRHAGEIRFAVEAALPPGDVLAGATPRERAIAVFSELRVWDTEHNNGVLIYLLLADHDVEIVADRGVAGGRVPTAEWEACCQVMEAQFRAGRFREGAIAGIRAVAEVLAQHPPARPDHGNELPDAPVLL